MGEEEQGAVTASFLAIAGFKEGYYTLSFSVHESIVFRYEILLSKSVDKEAKNYVATMVLWLGLQGRILILSIPF
ncbi:MAG: hypothetical protein PWQ22_671 [Archaeoglobaceae archaeon]|nr:hypothetical protein [Archaeoglobaceae archaeon]MDK2876261.1 hypothetical protein [Archaeoglobaceae archaeon]